MPLQTKVQQCSTASKLRTPRSSQVPPKPLSIHLTPSKLPPVPVSIKTPQGPPPSPLYPAMASGYKRFSPVAYQTPAPPAPTPTLTSTRPALDLNSAIQPQAVSTTVVTSQQALYDEMQSALDAKHSCITPRLSASILGKIRSIGKVAPWGRYISFSLAEGLKAATRRAFDSTKRTWWTRGKIRLSNSIKADLQFLCDYLREPKFSPLWSPNSVPFGANTLASSFQGLPHMHCFPTPAMRAWEAGPPIAWSCGT
jgi:hypothetical protein